MQVFAYCMHALLSTSPDVREMFEERVAACRRDERLDLIEEGGLAGWETRVVRRPQPRDGSNCGCFSFIHMHYRVRGSDVAVTSGSGDLIRLSMLFEVVRLGRRFELERSS